MEGLFTPDEIRTQVIRKWKADKLKCRYPFEFSKLRPDKIRFMIDDVWGIYFRVVD